MQSCYLEVKKTGCPSNCFHELGWHHSMCFAESQSTVISRGPVAQCGFACVWSGFTEHGEIARTRTRRGQPGSAGYQWLQTGSQHFRNVCSVGVITLSTYIFIYLILTTNLWGTHYCYFTDEQTEAQGELSTPTYHQLIVGELGPEPSSPARSCPETLLHCGLCGQIQCPGISQELLGWGCEYFIQSIYIKA